MRISDWSSDVCSSDLRRPGEREVLHVGEGEQQRWQQRDEGDEERPGQGDAREDPPEVALGLRPRANARDEAPLLADVLDLLGGKIGRAARRERVCQYV